MIEGRAPLERSKEEKKCNKRIDNFHSLNLKGGENPHSVGGEVTQIESIALLDGDTLDLHILVNFVVSDVTWVGRYR
jgi:hypothetical protein